MYEINLAGQKFSVALRRAIATSLDEYVADDIRDAILAKLQHKRN